MPFPPMHRTSAAPCFSGLCIGCNASEPAVKMKLMVRQGISPACMCLRLFLGDAVLGLCLLLRVVMYLPPV